MHIGVFFLRYALLHFSVICKIIAGDGEAPPLREYMKATGIVRKTLRIREESHIDTNRPILYGDT